VSVRRPLYVGSLALTLTLTTAACGGSQPEQESEPVVAGCTSPPELPGEVPSYAQTDLPDATGLGPDPVAATVRTSCGDLTVELNAAAAPQTVASFVFLAQEGYWEDSPCHRLTTQGIYVLQCGDPSGSGRGGPGYVFGLENAPADGKYPPGTLAMARTSDPNSNGGQFFIVHGDTELPVDGGGYSIFGRVTNGMEVVDAVAAAGAQGTTDGAPAQPISILSVEVDD
jgi:peptidyl-prolyl cis-trans isomerase B (cyclophilin B)